MADASFNNETLHVVKYFNGVLQTKNEKIINDVFNQLVLERSQININANRTTADKIRELDKKIHKENKEVSHSYVGMICMRIFGVLLFIVGIMFILWPTVIASDTSSLSMCLGIGIPLAVVGITLFGLSWLVKKSYLTNKKQLNDLQNERDHEFSVAQSQLADLKSHICNYLTYSIFEQTYPLIQFARYFSEADYLNWTSWLKNDVNSSVLYCLSGTLKTNPFIVLKTKSTEMYDHVYTGSRIVMVRRTRIVNGRSESYMASKIVTATTTNPAPHYWTDTKLFYKSNAADSLDFVNLSQFKNEKKAEKYFNKSKDMEPMDNPEFDRYFPCQRNDEVQFRTLFSPLAQEEMIQLMKFKNDYRFTKHQTLNIISSSSFDYINFDVNYAPFVNVFDYEDIKNGFVNANKQFFKDIYFMFAPILTIPLYQQYEYRQPLFEKAQQKLISYVQNESIANTMHDPNGFKHQDSVTDTILKTKRVFANSLYEINEIIAYGYRATNRVVIVPVADFEAGLVNVPVTVIDYHSVQRSTQVVNAASMQQTENDFDLNNNSIKAIWTRYTKSLKVDKVVKKGSLISMIVGDKSLDQNTYATFIKELSNVK